LKTVQKVNFFFVFFVTGRSLREPNRNVASIEEIQESRASRKEAVWNHANEGVLWVFKTESFLPTLILVSRRDLMQIWSSNRSFSGLEKVNMRSFLW